MTSLKVTLFSEVTRGRPKARSSGNVQRSPTRRSPGPPLSVPSVSGAAAVSDVVTIDCDQLLAALGRLLLLPELVVLPAALVFPQLPVSAFRPEDTDGEDIDDITSMR